MSNEERKSGTHLNGDPAPVNGRQAVSRPSSPPQRELLPLPGLVAIALYLLLLAVVIVVGVMTGHYRPFFLSFPVFLITALGGLLMRFRWAWAMALAAVVLLSGYNFWIFATLHMSPSLVQGML